MLPWPQCGIWIGEQWRACWDNPSEKWWPGLRGSRGRRREVTSAQEAESAELGNWLATGRCVRECREGWRKGGKMSSDGAAGCGGRSGLEVPTRHVDTRIASSGPRSRLKIQSEELSIRTQQMNLGSWWAWPRCYWHPISLPWLFWVLVERPILPHWNRSYMRAGTFYFLVLHLFHSTWHLKCRQCSINIVE